jgi:hypothetical protein
VLKGKIAIFNLILNVVVVDINVFSALIVALTCYKLDRGLVIRLTYSALVVNVITSFYLLKQ